MKTSEIKEMHDNAWNSLEEKGFSLGERMKIRSSFSVSYKYEYPFIRTEFNSKDNVVYYYSTIKSIDNYIFSTEKEVIMANAIFENTKDNFDINTFMQNLKYTFKILGINSNWNN